MCRPALVVGALLLLAPRIASQEASRWRDSTVRLAGELRALQDSLLQKEARLAEVGRRSGLVLSASPGMTTATLETLRRFDEARRRWFGSALPAEAGFRITLHGTSRRGGEISIAGLPDSAGAARASPHLGNGVLNDADAVVREFLFHYGQMMLAGAGRTERWLPVLPLTLTDPARREQAMYVLVTGAGRAQRGCTNGNLADCGYALGLRPPVHPDPGGQYLHLARADFLLAALDHGGGGAWDRLRLASDTGLEARLASAGGAPMDSLISVWRRDLLSLRPARTPVGAREVAMLVLWSAVAGLAAIGTARWR